ncbi:MAG: glycerol-3-phosphate acyltransferase [Erysipelotrichaceae bacterium]|nr:glycerol-3-phosphate acyltransferase [Erysipelotrichaceae bacterium]
MNYLTIILISYILGSFSPAYFLGKMKGKDLTKEGTGNLGASNTKVVLGWGYGIAVAVIDISKAAIAVYISKLLFGESLSYEIVACVSAVMGHMFPFYLKFRGGKGYASYTGGILMINWKIGLAFIVAGILITLITNYIALATISSSIAYPVVFYFLKASIISLALMVCLAVVIIYKHRENLKRIAAGNEIGLFKKK